MCPSSLKATIDDWCTERNDIMGNKLPPHRRSTDVVRQLNSVVSIIEGLSEIRDSEYQTLATSKQRADYGKDVQTLNHLNGKVKYKGNIFNSEYHGLGVLYHYNGTLLYKGTFREGEPDGADCEIFHFNANLKYRGPVNKGVYSGAGTLYHDNGCLKYDGIFLGDKPHSEDCSIFHSNGNLEYAGKILNGLYEGLGVLNHRNGNLEYEGNFKRGGPHTLAGANGLDEEALIYYDNGRIKFKGQCRNGYFDGCGTLYNRQGVSEYYGSFKNGQRLDADSDSEDNTRIAAVGGRQNTQYGQDSSPNKMRDLSLSEISKQEGVYYDLRTEPHEHASNLPVMLPGPPIEKIAGIVATGKSYKSTISLAKPKPEQKKIGNADARGYSTNVPTTNIKKDSSKGAQTVGGPREKAKAGPLSQRGSMKNGLTAGIGNLFSVNNFSLKKSERQETGSRSKRVEFGQCSAKGAKSHQRPTTRGRSFSGS
jgi:antitoxin component YwqK of YwqJK toxin-antitoxin module